MTKVEKIYEFIMLILYWLLYGISIGCVIFKGLKDNIQIVWFIFASILIITRTLTATMALLIKEQDDDQTRTD